MMITQKTRLNLAALAAASSFIALSAPAQAQSVCDPTAGTIDCLPSVSTITFQTAGATVGGQVQGIRIVSTADQSLAGSGTINTNNGDTAVVLTSTGNLAVATGANGPLSAVATGTGGAFSLTSGGTLNATLGTGTSATGSALDVTGAGTTAVTTGTLTSGGAATATVRSATGDASLTVNGNVSGTGTDTRGVGVVAPNGNATLIVNGNVTTTGTGANAIGVGAVGVNSTVTVGNVSVVGGSAFGAAITAVATGGTASVTCGNVTSSADGVAGVVAAGTDVVIRCGNVSTTGDLSDAVVGIATNSIDAQVGNLSTTGLNSVGLNLVAPGTITASAGTISTTGDTASALTVLGGDGAITLSSGNISTTGDGSLGIAVTSLGSVTVNNAGRTVTTTGLGSNGVVIDTADAINLNVGRVSATGTGSVGVATTSLTGAQTLNIAGAAADLDGIRAISTGTGSIAINATAPVTSTNGTAIVATGTTGAITINEAGASGALGGVRAVATGVAPVSVFVTGGTTTATAGDAIQLTTLGSATTDIAAGATVRGSGAFDAIETNGTLSNTVTNRGTIALSAGGTGYAVRATGAPTRVDNLAGGTLTGPVLLTAGIDTVNNAGTLTFTGSSDFGLGSDVLNNQAGGNLALTQGATVLGLENLNNFGGVTAVGTTALTGTSFNNRAGGTLTATGGAANLTGLVAFNNFGTIALQDGAANDTLTLSGNYTGNPGSRLTVDADAGLSAADRLVIGGNISGSTQVDVNFVGTTPLFNQTGVLIVDGGGTAAANAFAINPANVQQGFLNYGIRQAGNDFFLASDLDASTGELALVNSAGREMWYQSFDAYHDSIMGRQGSGGEGKLGMWANLYYGRDKYGDRSVTTTEFGGTQTFAQRIDNRRRGAQGGLEYRAGGFTIGVTGGYEHNRAKFGVASRMDIEGYNYGAYVLFGGETGLYGGVMAKRDDYEIDFQNNTRLVGFNNDAHSEGVDGELGLRIGTGVKFDLNAGASYVRTRIDGYDNYGLSFDFDDNDSLRGRAGARIIFADYLGAFVGAKVFHEFRDNGRVDISNTALIGSFDGPDRGTWVRVEGGLGADNSSGLQITAWGDFGDTKGFGIRGGFHF